MKNGGNNDGANLKWTVLVLDQHGVRLESVDRAISACGATRRLIEGRLEREDTAASAACRLVLVGLEGVLAPAAPILGIINVLRKNGFQVLAYADGIECWRPSEWCLPMLAGAANLLNSSEPTFEKKLRESIAGIFEAELGRAEEERAVRQKMAEVGVVGQSPEMIALFRNLMRISGLNAVTILITGESDTGKELVAKAIHYFDPKRRNGPFIKINLAALPPNLVESQLFGHRRGAFTGAFSDCRGLIRAAHGGVLFLDEIGEFELGLQAKLLRVIQEKRVLCVGQENEVAVDIRLVAATNRNLKGLVAEEKFRHDLFERLNVLGVHIPPLRDRREDVLPLIQFFLEKHQALSPNRTCAVAPEFVEALCQLELPGNAREVERLVCSVLAKKKSDRPLSISDLPREAWVELCKTGEIPQKQADQDEHGTDVNAETRRREKAPKDKQSDVRWPEMLELHGSLEGCLEWVERGLVGDALRRSRGERSDCARMLKVSIRTIGNKLRKYGLEPGGAP